MYKFDIQSKIGYVGVKDVISYFEKQHYIKEIKNLEDDIEEQRKSGTDIIVIRNDTKHELTMDVKTDTRYDTGNFFIETISVVEQNKPGWLYKNTTDYIAYYYLGRNKMYLLPLKDLQKWATKNIAKYKTKMIPNKGYYTQGILVPRVVVCKEISSVKEINI